MAVLTGKDTSVVFYWEDEFAQDPAEVSDEEMKTFGSNVTIGTNEGSNNAVRQFQPGSRQAEYIIEQQFSGSWSVDFTLTNPSFLRTMFGEPETDELVADEEYEHRFEGQFPESLILVEQVENSDGTFDHRILTGCIASSVSVDSDVEDMVNISVDGAYVTEELFEDVDDEETEAPYESFLQPATDYRPLHFANANLYISEDDTEDATVRQSLIQNASLDLEGNVDIVYEIGTRLGVDFSPKALEPSMSYTRLIRDNDTTDQTDMYGASAATSPEDPVMEDSDIYAEIVIDNGQTGEDKNLYTFELYGTLADSVTRNNIGDPESDIEADVDRMISEVNVTVRNSDEEVK